MRKISHGLYIRCMTLKGVKDKHLDPLENDRVNLPLARLLNLSSVRNLMDSGLKGKQLLACFCFSLAVCTVCTMASENINMDHFSTSILVVYIISIH